MMGTEIFKIDASWAEKLTKTRVSFLTAPTVELMVMGPGAGAGAGTRKSMWGWRGHGPRNSQDLY